VRNRNGDPRRQALLLHRGSFLFRKPANAKRRENRKEKSRPAAEFVFSQAMLPPLPPRTANELWHGQNKLFQIDLASNRSVLRCGIDQRQQITFCPSDKTVLRHFREAFTVCGHDCVAHTGCLAPSWPNNRSTRQ